MMMNQTAKNADLSPAAFTLSLDTASESENVSGNDTAYEPEQICLSESELETVENFSEKLDLSNPYIILQYGAAAQKKIAGFSDTALNGVRTKDLGQVGGMITDLMEELRGFSVEEKRGLFSFFQSTEKKLTRLKLRYNQAEDNVDRITGMLEQHQNQLLTDIVMLDRLYDTNQSYLKELTMYIMAGKKKLERERSTTLIRLQEKARSTTLAEDSQAANDFASVCDRFEKKLHDLELTRMISIQMSPQIRLIQNSNTLMAEKIQSTINNTIPLWKNQMVLALGMVHTREALAAQRKVNETTNELLRKNADALRAGTTQIAKESEKSIVDLETVRYSNEQLISTLDEVLSIQKDGRQKRLEAENELFRIEAQLKEKLIDIES